MFSPASSRNRESDRYFANNFRSRKEALHEMVDRAHELLSYGGTSSPARKTASSGKRNQVHHRSRTSNLPYVEDNFQEMQRSTSLASVGSYEQGHGPGQARRPPLVKSVLKKKILQSFSPATGARNTQPVPCPLPPPRLIF